MIRVFSSIRSIRWMECLVLGAATAALLFLSNTLPIMAQLLD